MATIVTFSAKVGRRHRQAHSHRRNQIKRWLVQSRPQENPPEVRLQGSSWRPRPLVRARPPLVEWRNLTDTGPEQSLFVKSVGTRRAPSFSSESCHSSALCVKSLRTSRLISDSRAPPWWHCRRLARLTSSDYLRTPTCALSTPSVLPSCQRISSSPAASVESVPKQLSGLLWPLS